MTEEQAGRLRWMCQLYNQRGKLTDEQWVKFAAFCEQYGYTHDVYPGKMQGFTDRWDHFQHIWES